MKNFLLTDYFYHFEIVALILAILTYQNYKNTINKYLLIFLIITLAIETIGLIQVYNSFNPNSNLSIYLKNLLGDSLVEKNDWLYNIYYLFYYAFCLIYFRLLVNANRNKLIIFVLLIVYIIISLVDLFLNWNDFNSTYLEISRVSGTIFLLISICIYLFQVFNTNEILKFYLTLTFWVTIGTLFFNLITAPIYIYSDLTYKSDLYGVYYRLILNISNYILYGSFIIGFLINAYQKRKKLQNTSLSN